MKTAVKMIVASGISLALVKPILFAAEGDVQRAVENAQTKVENAAEDLKTATYDLLDKDITSISFAKGSSKLSKAEVSTLRAVYKAVQSDSTVDKVIVAAWGDEKLPSGGKLSDAEVELAQKRAEAIEDLLKKMGNKNTDSYNMAKDASWIAKVFETQNAEIKEAMKDRPTDDASANRIAQLLSAKGGVSKAVVIVKRQSPTHKAASN